MPISAEDLFSYAKLADFNQRMADPRDEPVTLPEVEDWITAHVVAMQTFHLFGPGWVKEERLGPHLEQLQQNYRKFCEIREDLITRFVWYLDIYDRLIARDPESERAALRRGRVLGDGLPRPAE